MDIHTDNSTPRDTEYASTYACKNLRIVSPYNNDTTPSRREGRDPLVSMGPEASYSLLESQQALSPASLLSSSSPQFVPMYV